MFGRKRLNLKNLYAEPKSLFANIGDTILDIAIGKVYVEINNIILYISNAPEYKPLPLSPIILVIGIL